MTKRITIQVEVTPDIWGQYHWRVFDANQKNNPYGLSLESGYASSTEVASRKAVLASKRFS